MRNLSKNQQYDVPKSGAVVDLNDFRNRDVVKLCELLLQKAISGEITGLIYTARIDDEDQGVSAIGCYAKDESIALPAMAQMASILNTHVQSRL